MSTSENVNIARLRGISDPLDRAAACQQFVVNGRNAVDAAQKLRDESIRQAHAAGTGTIDTIAARLQSRRNIVVDALRAPKR